MFDYYCLICVTLYGVIYAGLENCELYQILFFLLQKDVLLIKYYRLRVNVVKC